MKYALIMMLVTTVGGLGWEGRFSSAYEAAVQGEISKAAVEFKSSVQQALRDHDVHHNKRPIR